MMAVTSVCVHGGFNCIPRNNTPNYFGPNHNIRLGYIVLLYLQKVFAAERNAFVKEGGKKGRLITICELFFPVQSVGVYYYTLCTIRVDGV